MTRSQLLELGVSPREIERALEAEGLVLVRPGVYRLPGAPVTRDQSWMAAVLAANVDVVISHGLAATGWNLRDFAPPDTIDVLTTARRPEMAGVTAHHTKWLPRSDRTRLRRMPITTIERSVIDACGLVTYPVLERAVDDAMRHKRLRLPKLVRTFERIPVSGRRKRWPLEKLLEERVPGFNPGGSPAELDVLKILRRAGIDPLPEQQYRVVVEGHEHFLDYAWPETYQALEYDGVDFHTMVTDIHRGHDRTRRLQRADWTLWPVTKRTSESEIIAVGIHATT